MRHKVNGKKLNRDRDQRISLRRILVNQLFEHERIRTTRAKADAIRGQAEKMITLAKRGNKADGADAVHIKRLAVARLGDKEIAAKLFDDIAPRFENRAGGYTRIVKLGPRYGDSAEMVMLELVEE
jgi:large subunit ribosomal protein L17